MGEYVLGGAALLTAVAGILITYFKNADSVSTTTVAMLNNQNKLLNDRINYLNSELEDHRNRLKKSEDRNLELVRENDKLTRSNYRLLERLDEIEREQK